MLVAVHNRCETSRSFLSDLFDQICHEPVRIIVIDDGSSDGTGSMLKRISQNNSERVNLSVITGDGSWWWAKSMAMALDTARGQIKDHDVVVFMNDDISVPPDTLERLAESSRTGSCIIKATLRQVGDPTTILDRGCLIDRETLSIVPLPTSPDRSNFTDLDVAPGRTVAYPGSIFVRGLNIDHSRLPHHLADLEFSIRASREGFPIRLAEEIFTLSVDERGVSYKSPNIWHRLTNISSPDRLCSHWAFWRTALPDLPRCILLWRLFRFRLLPNLRSTIPYVNKLLRTTAG